MTASRYSRRNASNYIKSQVLPTLDVLIAPSPETPRHIEQKLFTHLAKSLGLARSPEQVTWPIWIKRLRPCHNQSFVLISSRPSEVRNRFNTYILLMSDYRYRWCGVGTIRGTLHYKSLGKYIIEFFRSNQQRGIASESTTKNPNFLQRSLFLSSPSSIPHPPSTLVHPGLVDAVHRVPSGPRAALKS